MKKSKMYFLTWATIRIWIDPILMWPSSYSYIVLDLAINFENVRIEYCFLICEQIQKEKKKKYKNKNKSWKNMEIKMFVQIKSNRKCSIFVPIMKICNETFFLQKLVSHIQRHSTVVFQPLTDIKFNGNLRFVPRI